MTVILAYDYLLTLDLEIEKVWRRSLQGSTVLFVIVRSKQRPLPFYCPHSLTANVCLRTDTFRSLVTQSYYMVSLLRNTVPPENVVLTS